MGFECRDADTGWRRAKQHLDGNTKHLPLCAFECLFNFIYSKGRMTERKTASEREKEGKEGGGREGGMKRKARGKEEKEG